jgi:phenylacetate-CoA ligase
MGDAPDGRLDPIERAGRDELAGVQLDRMRTTLRRVYDQVPRYRATFDRAGVRPDDLRELADITRFPFTTKGDLRDAYPDGMFAVPRHELARIHASSGTTGMPTVVGYTKRDIDTWADLMARSIRAAGGRPGDLVHVAYGYGLFTGGLGAHYGAERLGCTVVPASGGVTERQVVLIRDLRPDVVMVTPSYLLVILDEMERVGLDPRESSLRIGILGAEPWTEQMRAEIESRTRMTALDIYGLSEIMGPGVAQECIETKDGLHIWEDHFYPEIVDPISGNPLPDGEFGELVITTLTKEAMPLVRYRTRDLTRLLPGTARPMRRIQRITGRSDDMLIVRGVNVFPTQVEELVLRDPALSPYFQLVLTRPDRLDELTVRVEARGDASPGQSADSADSATRLANAVKDAAGVTVRVEIVAPGSIERSVGKAKRVVDLRVSR